MKDDEIECDFRKIIRDHIEQDERIPEIIRCLWQRIVQEMSQWDQANR